MFHHLVAILKGCYVPPLRVAAVADKGNAVIDDLKNSPDWTLIDGLQRTTCYIITVLMAALGDELVEMGCIDEQIWSETFREHAFHAFAQRCATADERENLA